MATPETWNPSQRMLSAAAAERERVERELARLEIRREQLARKLASLTAAQDELRAHLRVLNQLGHQDATQDARSRVHSSLRAVNSQLEPATANVLRGARIREVAVRVLAGTPDSDGPVHYRTWYELFTQRGFHPAGKDPVATFLTQVGRSPVVERGGGPGLYSLDFSFPARARQRLSELREELRGADELSLDASIDDIAAGRARRAQLTSEIEATERALEEALRSLGEET